eukprot:TRINITY_DN694_c0_g1_i3.p2 TRINITY_DN694_c0_g1~~TRINITY_DN694_c0_g1_i3.p2  ORF type:complete len:102 (+),score=5.66 TRINITY_DN694_c0_g1_i3:177-482(+)
MEADPLRQGLPREKQTDRQADNSSVHVLVYSCHDLLNSILLPLQTRRSCFTPSCCGCFHVIQECYCSFRFPFNVCFSSISLLGTVYLLAMFSNVGPLVLHG